MPRRRAGLVLAVAHVVDGVRNTAAVPTMAKSFVQAWISALRVSFGFSCES